MRWRWALELKERFGGEVIVITMGPPRAAEILKDSLCRGADRVILLSDRRFAASDTLATSYTIAQAIQTHLSPYDVVLCGRQAIDGDTAQVGPQVAEKLGIAQVTYADRDARGYEAATAAHPPRSRPRRRKSWRRACRSC